MIQDEHKHDIFSPSISWTTKSGVKVDYAPEDTMRSVIFENVKNITPLENGNVGPTDGLDEPTVEQRENPDGGLPCHNSEGMDTTHKTCDEKHNNNDLGDRQLRSRTIAKPAAFLKRRQGMSAWCSKIRKQGMPIRDPADTLRKKRTSDCSLSHPLRQPTKNTSKPMPSSATRNVPEGTISNVSPSCNDSLYAKPLGSLLCGFVSKRRPNSAKDQDGDTHLHIPHTSPVQSHPMSTSTRDHATESYQNSTTHGVCSDAFDLEEFELLEEMAENSSFSSLTTSFVSKLGKNSLRDRLKRAEEKLEKLALTDRSNDDTANRVCSSADFVERKSSNSPQRLCSEAAPEQPILSVADEHRPRPAASILANNIANKCKKVARFHLVYETTSQSKGDRSQDNQLQDQKEPEGTNPCMSDLEASYDEIKRSSVEFDDVNSWTGSATEQDNVEEPVRASSGMNISSTCSTQPILIQAGSKLPNPIAQPHRRDSSSGCRSPSKVIDTRWSDTTCARRSSPRPFGSSSKSPVPLKGNVASYETELINLADDFLDKFKREPNTSFTRSTSESHTVLRQWISRLEHEIRRFKSENANLLRLKSEREESIRRLESETRRFEEMKSREAKLFNEYKDNELRKLKKERRVLDEYQRALKSMPSKKDRDEIERLREELNDARSDLSKREVRWHAAIARLRSRIEELEAERDDLKGRVHRLEDERINLQTQLNKARCSLGGELRSNQLRRTISSTGPKSQTLNSVTQSIALQANKIVSQADTKDLPTSGTERRLQQQKQFLSSCRLSSRSASRVGGLESLGDIHARRASMFDVPSTSGSVVNRPTSLHEDNHYPSSRPRSVVSASGTRESVNSGGYFTGDDECRSMASEPQYHQLERQQNKGDTGLSQIPPMVSDLPVTVVLPDCDRTKAVSSALSGVSLPDEQLPVPGTAAAGTVVRSVKHIDGSTEETYSNGAVVVSYTNGSVKEIFPDGKTILVSLFNGDIKRTLPDGHVIYHYAADATVQLTHPDGTEEIHYADGRQEIIHPKSPSKTVGVHNADGCKTAGTELVSRRLPNGDREICLPNGQREIHSVTGIKCRIYPDGTTKTVFPDGRHETRYSSGRLRVKDAQGNLILDTRLPVSCRELQKPNPSPTALTSSPAGRASGNP
ncbi:hypothetical protein AHF37_04814 [Paragonimus kellicotti]|nr:hypothetical protein AHF37_04814 [Paragonimus kellicotti]